MNGVQSIKIYENGEWVEKASHFKPSAHTHSEYLTKEEYENEKSLSTTVTCSHKIEITGNTNDEHGLAINDQTVIIGKIQGQTVLVGESFINSKNNIISTGRNLFDEEVEYGSINGSGNLVSGTTTIRSKNYMPIVGGLDYYFRTAYAGSESTMAFFYYNSDKVFISRVYTGINKKFTTPANASYFKIGITADYGTIYNNDICVNVYDTDFNGTYEPYKKAIFNLNEELGYFDYIDEEDTVYKSTSKTYVLKGSSDSGTWSKLDTDSYPNVYRFKYTFNNTETPSFADTNKRGTGYSPTFEWTPLSAFAGITENSICFTQNDKTVINILIKKSLLSEYTLNAFYEYISNNPIAFVFKLDTTNVKSIDIPAGYSVYKNGVQYQDGTVPYMLSKKYSLNTVEQVIHSVDVNKEQQEQIDKVKKGTPSTFLNTPPTEPNTNGIIMVMLNRSD